MSGGTSHRYHSLDALRASMMLLGLVLHSAVSYVVAPLGPAWPYKDPATSTLFDMLVFVIHLFRMPVFFVAAGFFAAMLMERDGPRGFFDNRVKRVLIPLALCWPVLFVAITAGFTYTNGRAAGAVDMTPVTSGAFLRRPSLAHLWFLWDLMVFYVAVVAITPLLSRLSLRWRARVDSAFTALAKSPLGALAMALLTTVTLLPMEHPALETSSSFLPPVRVLVAYGVFFAFGWLLYRRRDVLEAVGDRWKTPMAIGAASAVAYLVITVGQAINNRVVYHIVGCAVAGLTIWMLIFGIVGLFVSRLDRPRPLVRYLSDASYWMYLIHLPFTIGIPGLLAPSPLPAVVKFAITLAVTSAATLVSYHYLVRSTAIGALLNGRRYPRSLPAPEPSREVLAV
jgi:peptidoglycan/LPS O-acetylase OafA/YrhL